MSAKTLLPNQCDLLHPFYGQDNCCLCMANVRIAELEKKIEELELKEATTQALQGAKS